MQVLVQLGGRDAPQFLKFAEPLPERRLVFGLVLRLAQDAHDALAELVEYIPEAVAISLAGGAAGIVLGIVGAAVIARTLNWATVVSPLSVVLAFGVAGFVGVFFGWYPAKRASMLDPIVALRHE